MIPNDAVNIRYLGTGDAQAWHGLWEAHLGAQKVWMPRKARRAMFWDLTSQNGRDAAMIVEVAGKAVGFAHFRIRRSDFAYENAFYLQEVFILPRHRATRIDGAGLAALAVRAVYAAASAQGAPAVYWLGSEHKIGAAVRTVARKIPAQTLEYSNEKAA